MGYVIVLFFVSTSHSNVEVIKNIDLKLIQFKHWNRPGFHCFNHFAMQLFINMSLQGIVMEQKFGVQFVAEEFLTQCEV